MSKRSANDSLDRLKGLIDGNNQIAVGLQVKLLRHVNAAIKKTKPSNPAKEKNLGSSQFEKKMHVSDEMCEFAGWEKGCLKSRVEVTNAIWGYVTENKLKSEQNKRICTLNDTLKSLLKVQTDTIMYPQIQKYIGQHLTKVEPVQE
jgi:chromatin remodeling complex protein RSC6